MNLDSHFSRPYVFFVRYPLLFCLISLILMGILAKRGFVDWRRMVHENESLKAKLVVLKKQHTKLERENDLLEKNTEYQENVIRQTLGYIRANETSIEFP